MVPRKAATANRGKAAAAPRQVKGKLMLNNPIIPSELDEDIDDDLAFDSEDERLYGGFFNAKDSKNRHDTTHDPDDSFDGDQEGGDDDYIDLADMLDMSIEQEKGKRNAKKSDAGAHGIKKKRSGKGVEAVETLFPDQEHHTSFDSALKQTIKNTGSASGKRVKSATESSLNLIAVDADDKTKDAITRKQVREATDSSMKKYTPVLRELNSSKHVQFPMSAPESNPIPSSLSAIAASATDRFASKPLHGSRNEIVAHGLTARMQSLLGQADLTVSPNVDSNDQIMFSSDGAEGELADQQPLKYVAKLKAMLASENSRRKRLNKIKSKTYRRILRKEKERDKEKREKAFELLHPDIARKRLATKLMKARAEERVTQKHKNTSAWIKHAKKFSLFDSQAKDAISEQEALHQRLMQKIDEQAGEGEDGDGEDNSGSEDETVVDQLLAGDASVAEVTSKLWNDGDSSDLSPQMVRARQELRDMKFMKSAKEREAKQYAEELRAFKEEVQQLTGESDGAANKLSGKRSGVGRMRFEKNGTDQRVVLGSNQLTSSGKPTEEADDDTTGVNEHGTNEFAGFRQTSRIYPKLSAGTKRPKPEVGEEVGAVATLPRRSNDDENQVYLVSRAFAGDDVDEDFQREKQAQVELMLKPEDVNKNLPGWGEWGGEDEHLNKRHKEKVAHSTLQRNIQKSFYEKSRADSALQHVIINHDGVDIVPDRMTLHMIPRPFSAPQEFARSMRQPSGPEWTSALSFVEGVQPRIEVHQGKSVTPLDLSLRRNTAKTKRRKVEG